METATFRVRSLVWFASGVVVTLLATLVVGQAWRVDAAPGDLDSTFVSITPCRLIDTRPAPDRVGSAGTFSIADTKTFAARGNNGECVGIPADAVGVSLNVTALHASQTSFLTIWPDGTRPKASSLDPSPGQPPVPNAVTVSLSGTGGFNVYNNAGTVNVIIDINGYYIKSSLTEVAALIAANGSKIADLDAREPFAVTARNASEVVTTTAEVVVSVTVTAPATGQVTVNSVATAFENTAGDDVVCSIATNTTPPAIDVDYVQQWESGGTSDGGVSQMAGTRTFDIAAAAIATYDLVCQHFGASGSVTLNDSVLTAIFTPAP